MVFVLIMDSIRQLYFENELTSRRVWRTVALVPLYRSAARAVARGRGGRAAAGGGRPDRRTGARLREALREAEGVTPREASIFACVCDTVVAPEHQLPAVRNTDAVGAFDRWLAGSPRPHRAALRGLLHAAELAPRGPRAARACDASTARAEHFVIGAGRPSAPGRGAPVVRPSGVATSPTTATTA